MYIMYEQYGAQHNYHSTWAALCCCQHTGVPYVKACQMSEHAYQLCLPTAASAFPPTPQHVPGTA